PPVRADDPGSRKLVQLARARGQPVRLSTCWSDYKEPCSSKIGGVICRVVQTLAPTFLSTSLWAECLAIDDATDQMLCRPAEAPASLEKRIKQYRRRALAIWLMPRGHDIHCNERRQLAASREHLQQAIRAIMDYPQLVGFALHQEYRLGEVIDT